MKKIHVAIVDDSKVIRERLVQQLCRQSGVQIAWQATNVKEATEALHREPPDVLILDLKMPDGSGCDVLNVAKKECPDTKVLILTNYAFWPLKKRCLKAGADYFFDKTSEFQKVYAVINSLTGQNS